MSSSIILASASPRRRELLERIGIPFQVMAADVDESVISGELAVPYATRVASLKARTIAEHHPDSWIVAADTVVEVDGIPLGKARDEAHARDMLVSLLGRTHRVTTAVALQCGDHSECTPTTTEVTMRSVSTGELDDYLSAGEWRGKAGAYAVQGMAAAFVTEIRGSVTNVIGLPLAELVQRFEALDVAVPSFQDGISA